MTPRTPAPELRERILAAAAAMLAENPTARLSVRAVAQRADISTGSLRHVFPTQRELIDAVVAAIAALEGAQQPDEALSDTSRPAVDRLIEQLRGVLATSLSGDGAREQLRAALASPETPSADDDSAPTLALERLALHQIAGWITALRHESAGDETPDFACTPEEAARFLSTVVSGLVTDHLIPGSLSRMAFTDSTLRIAASAVLAPRA